MTKQPKSTKKARTKRKAVLRKPNLDTARARLLLVVLLIGLVGAGWILLRRSARAPSVSATVPNGQLMIQGDASTYHTKEGAEAIDVARLTGTTGNAYTHDLSIPPNSQIRVCSNAMADEKVLVGVAFVLSKSGEVGGTLSDNFMSANTELNPGSYTVTCGNWFNNGKNDRIAIMLNPNVTDASGYKAYNGASIYVQSLYAEVNQ